MTQHDFGKGVEIVSAERASEAGPVATPHCRLEGIVNRRKGAGGIEYGIRFAIALPDDWNGRFLLQGGGGLNGTVHAPVGPVASGTRPALARGFAVLSHDSGHKGTVWDMTFMSDQRAALDFAEASVRIVALLGKQVTQSYYGSAPHHSYMTGCSTGGREGMLASQRYPELFDGIIVGAPAMRAGDSNLAGDYTKVLLNQVAPRGEDGMPDVTGLLTPQVRQTLLTGLLAQCDGLDGLKDGMIENVGACDFQPRKLQCEGEGREGCLSPALVGALEKGFAGPFDSAGYALYAPVAWDTGVMAMEGGYLPTGAPGPFGPPLKASEIDLDARINALRADAAGRLTDTNYWTNLNTYLDRGGKMIFFHGVSDFFFSPWATWDWYERAGKTNGARWGEASRFYMVPGMMHCRGGDAFDSFDMLGPLVEWVEQGKAPEAITAERSAPKPATRPLCPFPAYARYKGGDAHKAANFVCAAPDQARAE
ncbi:MAG: tannase/feruloyl esterase family alpha/beta hydrolase [Sphingomonadaceae bacterium]